MADKGLWNQVTFLYLSPALSAQRPLACGSCEALHLAFTEGPLHPGSFPSRPLPPTIALDLSYIACLGALLDVQIQAAK